MVSRLLLIYALVELAVIFALVSTIGWGWTLLALLATFLLGWGIVAPMAGSRLIRRIGQLRSGLAEQRAAAGDGALVSLAALLVLLSLGTPHRQQVEPAAFVRLPLEALVYLALVLALPPSLGRVRKALALVAGFVLGVLF